MSAFWGVEIEPGKMYSQLVSASFYIKLASLGAEVEDDARATVYLTAERKTFPISTLIGGRIMQQNLDLYIEEGTKITFRVSGQVPVHLVGHLAPIGEYMDYDDDDDEYDDDEEDADLEDMDDEEDSEDDDVQTKKALRRLIADEADDDEDDDEDDEEDDEEDLEDEDDEDDEEEDEEEDAPVNGKKRAAITSLPDSKRARVEEKKPEAAKSAQTPTKPVVAAAAAAAAAASPAQKGKQTPAAAAASPAQKAAASPAQKPAAATASPLQKKTLQGGLVMEDKVVGTGALAAPGKKIACYYYGKLKSGKMFDSCTSGKPFGFKLGAGEVIKGWDIGIAGMRVGGKRTLTIPAPLAYGARGSPPTIPPNSTLTFDVELKNVL
ncbi:FKBP-type peptidyl-prolyl cis-trans isomerase, variant [Capsaspora owczarzaki ATCC 30864]|uniref:FKBP-type peptidyl-prolyl cis-trans isomerase, variant n=1 Tax=Capsaspora owczarzaki (strain ATCC 30864) TaxID=595528 RepID=UPI0003521DC0|nr:FKBP-type peptidyl-prolyl cis-trans isomerase, variant [Capsaspora owczarzaki ATCC 30864]|eukprot:XP_011270059.1 FKBP-type peptidyl-prolyl cis-trans isomerase, variant [Capsaspora owczarzaki ATCC 30864]